MVDAAVVTDILLCLSNYILTFDSLRIQMMILLDKSYNTDTGFHWDSLCMGIILPLVYCIYSI